MQRYIVTLLVCMVHGLVYYGIFDVEMAHSTCCADGIYLYGMSSVMVATILSHT